MGRHLTLYYGELIQVHSRSYELEDQGSLAIQWENFRPNQRSNRRTQINDKSGY